MTKRWHFLKDDKNFPDDKIWIPVKHHGESKVHDLFPEDIPKEWEEEIETNERQGND
jgi:hypothetical protein